MEELTLDVLLKRYNTTMKRISDELGIPYRTLQNWRGGVTTPARWVLELLEHRLRYPPPEEERDDK